MKWEGGCKRVKMEKADGRNEKKERTKYKGAK